VKLTKEFKIGIVVVCAIAAFIWGISFLKGTNLFSSKYYLYALYPRIDNLNASNPVQVQGYKIGQIRSISLIERGGRQMVLVKFLLTEDVDIPKRSVARVVSADLLGNKAIEILFSKEKEMVKSGDTLLADSEQGLKESFNKQFAPLQARAEHLITNIDSLIGAFNYLLDPERRGKIHETFESVRKAILTFEKTAYKLDDMIETEKPKMSSIFTNLDGITGNLHKSEQKINNILTNFSSLSDSLSKSQLRTAITNADNTLRELNTLMVGINAGHGTLGKLAKNDSLYNNLNKSAENLEKLLRDLNNNPKKYVHFSIFGKKGEKISD
jgi:phospholipid/cholesterol/gamma-HCH transport system substrate-binding protein